VQHLFDTVEKLPEDAKVLMSLDYGPSTVPENDPMAHAVARHLLRKNVKVYLMTLWATGPPLINALAEQVVLTDFPGKVYGEDWVNLGYRTGNQGVIQALTSDLRGLFTVDAGFAESEASASARGPSHERVSIASRSIAELPMLNGVETLKDFRLVIGIGSGFPGLKEWVQFGGDPTGVDVGGGVTAVEAPLLYPYYPQQLSGLMGGLLGAAEYEAALTSAYEEFTGSGRTALVRMFPQMVAHLVIVGFVVLGNVSYFALRGKQRKGARG
jgi:hypothetical protein